MQGRDKPGDVKARGLGRGEGRCESSGLGSLELSPTALSVGGVGADEGQRRFVPVLSCPHPQM